VNRCCCVSARHEVILVSDYSAMHPVQLASCSHSGGLVCCSSSLLPGELCGLQRAPNVVQTSCAHTRVILSNACPLHVSAPAWRLLVYPITCGCCCMMCVKEGYRGQPATHAACCTQERTRHSRTNWGSAHNAAAMSPQPLDIHPTSYTEIQPHTPNPRQPCVPADRLQAAQGCTLQHRQHTHTHTHDQGGGVCSAQAHTGRAGQAQPRP
jgi:hypothetical protein